MRRDSPTRKKEECRGGDDERLRRLEKLENVLKRLDSRQEPENIVAETADRLAKMEEIITTMSRGKNEPQNGREAEASANRVPRGNRGFRPLNWGDVPERDEFGRHFTITVRPEDNRKINPYELKKVIKTITGQCPESIIMSERKAFAVKMPTREQSQKMVLITRTENVDGKVEKHNYFNERKGLIFI